MKTAALFMMAAMAAAAAPTGWYSNGGVWTNRKAIVIDHKKVAGTAALTNFPD